VYKLLTCSLWNCLYPLLFQYLKSK